MPAANEQISRRPLGRTGVQVSAIGLGGWHLGFPGLDEKLSIRIIRTAMDRGITFLDNSWDYNDGASEERMGKALRDGYRDRVFLMTKVDGRSKKEAHTLEVARDCGFTFDTVQMPLNVMDAHYRSFERLVLPEATKAGIGVLGMKSMGNGQILKSGTVSAIECLHYALALPTSVVITGVESMERLDQALEAVRTFKPMDAASLDAIRRKTRDTASRGAYELFKTSSIYDSTAQNPDWLGEEPERIKQAVPQ